MHRFDRPLSIGGIAIASISAGGVVPDGLDHHASIRRVAI
jgi:hypothetical protein